MGERTDWMITKNGCRGSGSDCGDGRPVMAVDEGSRGQLSGRFLESREVLKRRWLGGACFGGGVGQRGGF